MDLTVADILKCTNGILIIGNKDKICENYSRDTRTLATGDTFVAIKGENFDGNTLWQEAFENGADVVIMDKVQLNKTNIEKYERQNKTIIQVDNTITALGNMARYKRELYGNKLRVIAVTGSVGKTSTRDIIANVVSQKYKTLKTAGNSNNNIGLPFTILRLKDEEVAVIELGMNHLGEISYLTKIAKPDISVITNIGTAHIGYLGSRENILKAKLEILEGMEKPLIIINNDNDLLHKWYEENKEKLEIHTFGIEEKSEFQAKKIQVGENDSKFICETKGEKIEFYVPVGGNHFILNSLAATAVGKLLDLSNEQIINGIKSFELTKNRMEIHHLKNNITIVNDSYNASYESMKASLLSLKNITAKRKTAVLGDMFELGKFSEELHRKVGLEVYKNNIDELILIGNDAKFIEDETIKCGFNKDNIKYFENSKNLIEYLEQNTKAGDAILFKASHGMKLFEIADELKSYLEK